MSPRPLGTATIAVLQALADEHCYGFDIIDRTGLPSGTVYPALATLTRKALVRSRWESEDLARAEARPRRRYYELTRAGAVELEEARARLLHLGLVPPAAQSA
jgi:DNA-binding PadR family transcriptional regulator